MSVGDEGKPGADVAPAMASALSALARVPSDQLTILVLQQTTITKLCPAALRLLAGDVLKGADVLSVPSPTPSQPFEDILSIAEEAAKSADPSLVRRMLPSADCVVNIAILAASCADGWLSRRAKRLMPKLIDATTAHDVITAAAQAVGELCAESSPVPSAAVLRACRILSALLYHLPTFPPARNQSIPPTSVSWATSLARAYVHTDASAASSERSTALLAKASMLDCSIAAISRATSEADYDALAKLVIRLAASSGKEHFSGLLEGASLLADVLMVRPTLAGKLRDSLSRNIKGGSDAATFAEAQGMLNREEEIISRATDGASPSGSAPSPLGSGWAALTDLFASAATLSDRWDLETQSADAALDTRPQAISAPLLELVGAVVPHLAEDREALASTLSQSRFQGKGNEEVIQMLLDEPAGPETNVHEAQASTASSSAGPSRNRANIFDDVPLKDTQLRRKGKNGSLDGSAPGEGGSQAIPSSLRAAILARVAAQNAEADEASRGQEWNPFAEEEAALQGTAVGFEEELDDDALEAERVNRRLAVSNIGGSKGNARDWVRRLEDYDQSSAAEDDSEAEATHSRSTHAATTAPASTNGGERAGVAKERAAERVFVLAYSRQGADVFQKDAATRKSAARKALKVELETATGSPYDDNLIESWGTMFERNPRKEALLTSASSHDFLAGGNPNITTAERTGFGPDRGRGGRLPRGGGRGGNSSRGGADGAGGSRGGGGAGRGRGGGGHSGNDRGAKRKERQGNVQRTRGADRKARAMGGPGAGVQ